MNDEKTPTPHAARQHSCADLTCTVPLSQHPCCDAEHPHYGQVPEDEWDDAASASGQGSRARAVDPAAVMAARAQTVYDRAHLSIGGSPFCVADPCAWHPAEMRLRPPTPFRPVVLEVGTPSLVVIRVAEFVAATQEVQS